jgi:hypothetical protein
MARPITYAIRVTHEDGRCVFVRRGIGRGPIATFRTREQAEAEAEAIRRGPTVAKLVTVIERSHGRQDSAT